MSGVVEVGAGAIASPGAGPLALDASPELRHVQFWSQPGKPFICFPDNLKTIPKNPPIVK